MTKKYLEYFVSYKFTSENSDGLGNCSVLVTSELNTMDDIRRTEEKIKNDQKFKQVVILNIRLLD